MKLPHPLLPDDPCLFVSFQITASFLDWVQAALAKVDRAITLAKGASSLQSWMNSLAYKAEAEMMALCCSRRVQGSEIAPNFTAWQSCSWSEHTILD